MDGCDNKSAFHLYERDNSFVIFLFFCHFGDFCLYFFCFIFQSGEENIPVSGNLFLVSGFEIGTGTVTTRLFEVGIFFRDRGGIVERVIMGIITHLWNLRENR